MRRALAIVLQRRAVGEIEEADRWWRENRESSPDLFLTELERMLGAVALVPSLGSPAASERVEGVRRVLLRRSRYHVYFRVRDEATLEVLAVWHAARGTGPGL